MKNEIRFKKNTLKDLRKNLFDSEKEKFCVILAKKEVINDFIIFKEIQVIYPLEKDLLSSSSTHISIKKEFFYNLICSIEKRVDIDTLIEIHTHPFLCKKTQVTFSETDNNDEFKFFKYLQEEYPDLNYGSLVFSKDTYDGRIFHETTFSPLEIKGWNSKNMELNKDYLKIYDRNVEFMGLENLRKIFSTSKVVLAGVGGLGSIIGEQLLNMGVSNLVLIDNDTIEFSNLNRLVGAKYSHVDSKTLKVIALKEHLLEINPFANIKIVPELVNSEEAIKELITADRIFVTTDNHFSRAFINDFCLKYFIPFISVGVNITIENKKVLDVSGEIIKIFPGDNFCLRCLKRVNQIKIDYEKIDNKEIKEKFISKGYIKNEKEPAVKTLNSILASLSVDNYINEFTNFTKDISILIYENNKIPLIYEDIISIKNRRKNCLICNI